MQAFGYDANARLESEREYKGAELIAYLANPSAQATSATTYGYDAVGNRATKTVTTPAGTESTTYGYDANDRLTSEIKTTSTGSTVATTYTWDGNGNLASKTTPSEYTGYDFDADNRLIEVRRGSAQATANTVAKYGYDADGQRVRKETASGITNYLIDPTTAWPQVALETKGSQRTAYVWGAELRQQAKGAAGSANTSPTEALVPLGGHLGTTIAAIDKQGNVVERYEATAFGELANESPKAAHQYTGEYWEPEARLTYLRARWYEPTTARMPSIDPAMGRITDARSLNRYAYAQADANNQRDPSGGSTLTEQSVVVGGIGTSSTLSGASMQVYLAAAKAAPAAVGGVGYLSTRGQGFVQQISGAGWSGIRSLQGAFLRFQPVITEAQSRLAANWSRFDTLKAEMNMSFGRPQNPSAIQWHVGRAAIAAGLGWYYARDGWLDKGRPTIGYNFALETPRFIASHQSAPLCQRPPR